MAYHKTHRRHQVMRHRHTEALLRLLARIAEVQAGTNYGRYSVATEILAERGMREKKNGNGQKKKGNCTGVASLRWLQSSAR